MSTSPASEICETIPYFPTKLDTKSLREFKLSPKRPREFGKETPRTRRCLSIQQFLDMKKVVDEVKESATGPREDGEDDKLVVFKNATQVLIDAKAILKEKTLERRKASY